MADPDPTPQDTPDSDIRLESVTQRFAETLAVDDLSLEIERGSFFAMLGPSGCGKTTTLRMIGGFEDPTAGQVFLGGINVTDHPPFRRDVNTVFQSYALFPHLPSRRTSRSASSARRSASRRSASGSARSSTSSSSPASAAGAISIFSGADPDADRARH